MRALGGKEVEKILEEKTATKASCAFKPEGFRTGKSTVRVLSWLLPMPYPWLSDVLVGLWLS